ncbi:uncharacterized protein MELLADRAFT_104748 [Melampsora larici-populina 98AG31]|uniref:Uncharacterized protein n=1 Tax=Melampsora larici-populina (strain 98AG31 / pathotype 3-4-7) TaxID=747676 RepID=F4RFS6_MELLP|nr:uncharacterized protein MELLADRAFT_104748 [Melampsora larici-populina 98AG31]EGG08860.1 hypothetical protein MELLADRAFT_104748 [Melampsora larici-populina 98AG31]
MTLSMHQLSISSFPYHYILLQIQCSPSFTPDSISLLPIIKKLQNDCFGPLSSNELSLIWTTHKPNSNLTRVILKISACNATQFLAAIPLLSKPINDQYQSISVISQSHSLINLSSIVNCQLKPDENDHNLARDVNVTGSSPVGRTLFVGLHFEAVRLLPPPKLRCLQLGNDRSPTMSNNGMGPCKDAALRGIYDKVRLSLEILLS